MSYERIRVLELEAESSGAITRAVGEALAPYRPDAVMHVSHAIANKPDTAIVAGPGEPTFLYSVLILVRELVAD